MKQFLFALICISLGLFSCNLVGKYKNGTYTGRTQSIYKEEPFVGVSTVVVRNHKIDSVYFYIVDTSQNEIFDETYERHYVGINEEYVQQCRNDWKGIQRYPKVLLQKQQLEGIDAVSGATWSYNMFKDATKIALEKAKR